VSVGFGHYFAGVFQNPIKELSVLIGEVVSLLLLFAFGKGCVCLEKMANVGATPLNELGCEPTPVDFISRSGEIGWQSGEVGIQQDEQGSECIFFYRCAV
jgi:hypothetical protein